MSGNMCILYYVPILHFSDPSSDQMSDGDLSTLDEFYNWGKNLPFCQLNLIGESNIKLPFFQMITEDLTKRCLPN